MHRHKQISNLHLYFRDNEKQPNTTNLESIFAASEQGGHPKQVHELVQQKEVLSSDCRGLKIGFGLEYHETILS